MRRPLYSSPPPFPPPLRVFPSLAVITILLREIEALCFSFLFVGRDSSGACISFLEKGVPPGQKVAPSLLRRRNNPARTTSLTSSNSLEKALTPPKKKELPRSASTSRVETTSPPFSLSKES